MEDIWTAAIDAFYDDEARLLAHYGRTVGCMNGPQMDTWLEEVMQDIVMLRYSHALSPCSNTAGGLAYK